MTQSIASKQVMTKELSSRYGSSTELPMERVALLSSYTETKQEQLKACCKPTYNIRKLRNKGAIAVLIMNYFLLNIYYYFVRNDAAPTQESYVYYITLGLTLPLVGWITDVYIGRYRMIRWSIWMVWVTFMLVAMNCVVAQLVDSYSKTKYYTNFLLCILVTIGMGCYQGNVIQFGIDQLQDASTDEITSFITWYIWTNFSAGIVLNYVSECLPKEYLILIALIVSISTSIATFWMLISDKMYIREPVSKNPFILVHRVIKYAINNKRPKCRSAFTYCEDELPSRIDFGKSKYGGPFTTEQVEDVKTFFRLLPIILFASILPSIITVVNQLSNQINSLIYHQITSTTTCYTNKIYTKIFYFMPVVIIPLYEFTIFPVVRKHLLWVKSSFKLLLGVLLQMARVFTLMVFVLKARHSYLEHNDSNATMQCIFEEDVGSIGFAFNSKWMILPNILNSISFVTLLISTIEFICAQTPYSMRGLMFGTVYGCIVIFGLVGYGIKQPFTGKLTAWGTGIISCGFWYLLMNALFLGIIGTMLFILGALYRKRKREDVLPNEQIFAERYFST